MKEANNKAPWLPIGILGLIVVAGLMACARKHDPAAANAGGGAANRAVITMKGAAR